jgi:hypothetical protein
MLGLLYLISYLDRTNIGTLKEPTMSLKINRLTGIAGNANIEGLTEDLGLTSDQYNIALSILFVPYVLLGM